MIDHGVLFTDSRRRLPAGAAWLVVRRHSFKLALATAAGALLLAAGLTTTALAAPGQNSGHGPGKPTPSAHQDEPLVPAFEQVSRSTSWTLSKTQALSWWKSGMELEAMEVRGDRVYVAEFDHDNLDGHLLVLDQNGNLLKDVTMVDGDRDHAGGLSIYGDYAYLPLAVDSPNSSADILRIDLTTYQVKKLFTVNYDHVGGLIYNPVTNTIVGQDWGSREFYEWTMRGDLVAKWANPQGSIDYQDCQYVAYDKMLCSGVAGLGNGFTLGGFDLIDLAHGQHTILNTIPITMTTALGNDLTGNPTDLRTTKVPGGTQITMFAAPDNAIYQYTTVIPDAH